MAVPSRLLRADEVPGIPVQDPAITSYELVNGRLVPITGANPAHAWLMGEIAGRLRDHAIGADSGAVFIDVWCKLPLPYDRERLRAPDVAYFGKEKLARRNEGDFFREAPDIAVEIHLETNQRKGTDLHQRIRDFVDGGARLLWVIHPDPKYALVYRADGSARIVRETGFLEGEDVFPGFRLELGKMLREAPGPP
jgi:Uma2 family endonuclease